MRRVPRSQHSSRTSGYALVVRSLARPSRHAGAVVGLHGKLCACKRACAQTEHESPPSVNGSGTTTFQTAALTVGHGGRQNGRAAYGEGLEACPLPGQELPSCGVLQHQSWLAPVEATSRPVSVSCTRRRQRNWL